MPFIRRGVAIGQRIVLDMKGRQIHVRQMGSRHREAGAIFDLSPRTDDASARAADERAAAKMLAHQLRNTFVLCGVVG